MSEDVFIGVVTSEGSTDPIWHGVFRFDEVDGYSGKLLSKFEIKAGKDLFDIPTELDKRVLFCVIDGAQYGTIIWPRFSGQQLKNFASRIIQTRIATLVRGVHVGEDDACVSQIELTSPMFATLLGLRGYNQTIQNAPLNISIQSNTEPELQYDLTAGKCFVGLSHRFSPSVDGLSAEIHSAGYLRIVFSSPRTVIASIKLMYQIEQLFSLLCFSYIKSKRLELELKTEDRNGDRVKTKFEVERARLIKGAKTEIDWHELPLRLKGINLAAVIDRFLEIFEDIEQTLNWYRIVVAEERYLEDKYFYSVRMIEALYRALAIDVAKDSDAIGLLQRVCATLQKAGDCELVTFVNQRVAPIFNKSWALPDIIRDLKARYSEMAVIKLLDEKLVNRLRGKETHGSSQGFSGNEYKFMALSYGIITMLYTLVVLESCGLSRDYLLNSIKRSPCRDRNFSPEYVERLKSGLAGE
jgi:hypothetical protein